MSAWRCLVVKDPMVWDGRGDCSSVLQGFSGRDRGGPSWWDLDITTSSALVKHALNPASPTPTNVLRPQKSVRPKSRQINPKSPLHGVGPELCMQMSCFRWRVQREGRTPPTRHTESRWAQSTPKEHIYILQYRLMVL